METLQKSEEYGLLRYGAKKEQKNFDNIIFDQTRKNVNERTLKIAQMNNRGSNFGIADKSGFVNIYPKFGDAIRELDKSIDRADIIDTLAPNRKHDDIIDDDDKFFSPFWFQGEDAKRGVAKKPTWSAAVASELNENKIVSVPTSGGTLRGFSMRGDDGFMVLFKTPRPLDVD
jgi:hypothetical protein